MAFQNLFILGSTGQVGRELVRQINEFDLSSKGHLNPTRIVGIANSRGFDLDSKGISGTGLPSTGYETHDEILQAVKKAGLEGEIVFVDVTAEGPKMAQFHQKVIKETVNKIVTANKKPLVGPMETFVGMTGNPGRYRYNTSVMAGASAVPYLQEAHGLSEKVLSVVGTFSGTLAYVCSELEKGEKPFSKIVREAKDKGYTEPHPLDDLSGEDVRRKLVILLRSAGIAIEEHNVRLEGLVDSERYANLDPEAFLNAISEEDPIIGRRVSEEREKGNVPRYVAEYDATLGEAVMKVSLQFVAKDSELGSLK
jgi:aspartokinase/homoserine dehydrogenase 1